jgi:lactate permease
MNFLLSITPLLLLIIMMSHPRGLPGSKALPLVAVLSFIIVTFFLHIPLQQAWANTLAGILTALTPLSIVAGALFLFFVLEKSGALSEINAWIQSVSKNRVAQLMLIGWAFPFLIEGISGFGTPAALAAPLLVGLGFSPLKACFMTLIANTVPVSFGAIGTPFWFGFEALKLSPTQTLDLASSVATVQLVCGLFVPLLAVAQVLSLRDVWANWKFIVSSSLCTTVPMWLTAQFSAEFPSVIGGAIGFMGCLALAKRGWGLAKLPNEASPLNRLSAANEQPSATSIKALARASFPIWGSVLLLLVTRLPSIGLKEWLTQSEPLVHLRIPGVGPLTISSSLVFQLDVQLSSLDSLAKWSHALLYIPSLIPFVAISMLFLLIFPTQTSGRQIVRASVGTLLSRLKGPSLALFGALVIVRLLSARPPGGYSAIDRIGEGLGSYLGTHWSWFAIVPGIVGAFFSGSATVSNLTFGPLQAALAAKLGDPGMILTLQAVGAALGNMVCLHNIIAVTTILGLKNQDGLILRQNAKSLLFLSVLSTLVTFVLYAAPLVNEGSVRIQQNQTLKTIGMHTQCPIHGARTG